MRKQTGKIYVRDLSKSTQKTRKVEESQNFYIEDQRTIRKDSLNNNLLRVPKNSKSSTPAVNSQSSWHHTISQQTSRQFSSIHQSSAINDSAVESSASFSCGQQKLNETSFGYQCGDSLAIYQNPVLKNGQIVKKLTHLNNIFKEIKNLRLEKFNKSILNNINETERDLIQVQRQILRNC